MFVNRAGMMPATPPPANTSLIDAKERREMRAELQKIREQLKSWGRDDIVSQKIGFWLDGFVAALQLENDAKEIIERYLQKLLKEVLIDAFTRATLTEDMVLGSDHYTYNPKTLYEFRQAFNEELCHFRTRSPLNIQNEAELSTEPHHFGAYVLRWANQKLGISPEPITRRYYGDVIIEDVPEEDLFNKHFHPDDIRIRNADDPESDYERDNPEEIDSKLDADNDSDSDFDTEFEEELRQRRAAREAQNARIHGLDAVNQMFQAEHERLSGVFRAQLDGDREDWRRYGQAALAHLGQVRDRGLERAAVVERAIAEVQEGIQHYARENEELERRNERLRANIGRSEASTNQLQQQVNEAERRMNKSNGNALKNIAMTIGIVVVSVCASYALAKMLSSAMAATGANAGLSATNGGGMVNIVIPL